MSGQFRVLIVCTGNICRSPLAERLIWVRLQERLGEDACHFLVHSAGTQAIDGAQMDRRAAAELARLGGSSEGFRSKRLSEDQVLGTDLVLTAAREHRSAVLSEAPEALRRTFTMCEFVHLAGQTDGDALLAERVAAMARIRGSATLDDYDITDPYGQSPGAHRAAAVAVAQAADAVVDVLAAAVRFNAAL